MDKELLDSLAVPTGEVGWPQKGDYLGVTRYRKKQWYRVEDSFSSKDDGGNTVQSIFIDSWRELPIGWKSKIELRKKFPHHVSITKLLQELIESRDYIKQVAPLAHVHGFRWEKK